MCCLKYEQDTYEELLKVTPRAGSLVDTPDGRGTVEYVSLLKGQLKVKIEDDKEKTYRDFDVKDVKVLKKPKSEPRLEKNDEEMLKKLED